MTKDINEKAVELTDEEIEKTAGGGELIGTVEKRCQHCFNIYSHTLEKCPSCGSTQYAPVTVYPKNPDTGGGPR